MLWHPLSLLVKSILFSLKLCMWVVNTDALEFLSLWIHWNSWLVMYWMVLCFNFKFFMPILPNMDMIFSVAGISACNFSLCQDPTNMEKLFCKWSHELEKNSWVSIKLIKSAVVIIYFGNTGFSAFQWLFLFCFVKINGWMPSFWSYLYDKKLFREFN